MTSLVRYEAACKALSDASSVDEVREVLNKIDAVRVYARQAKNKKLENDAKIIRWRAIRRLGQMVAEQPKARGGKPYQTNDVTGLENNPVDIPNTLADEGIDKNLANIARRYAAMDETSFDRLVKRCQAHNDGVEKLPLDILASEEKEARRDAAAAAYADRTAKGCTVADLNDLIASGAKFKTIYADPPWAFTAWSGKGKDRSADNHYDTDGLAGIKALPVDALADEDCALLMWCFMPELAGALEVIRAWGFEYKTVGFSWVKENKSGQGLFWGMGYWTRANVELCLLATRGKPERLDKGVHQVVMTPIAEHSRKPDEVRHRIERLVGGPYLELYGRRPAPGWTVWGNEIPREQFARDGSGEVIVHDPATGEIIAA